MRHLLLSLALSLPLNAAWTLGTGPFTAQDTGIPIQVNTLEGSYMMTYGGSNFWINLYDTDSYASVNYQVVGLNVTTGTSRITNSGVLGRCGLYKAAFYNGKLYLGSSQPSNLIEYDVSSGAVRSLTSTNLASHTVQWMEISDDNKVLLGEYPNGIVEMYDPVADSITNFGRIDTNGPTPQYAYMVGGNATWVFAVLGESPWYLGCYNRTDGSRTNFFKTDSLSGLDMFRKGTNWFVKTEPADQWYWINNGTSLVATNEPAGTTHGFFFRGNLAQTPSRFPQYFNTEAVLLNESYPNSFQDTAVYISRPVGAGPWTTNSISGFIYQPSTVRRLYQFDSSTLLALANFYGPVFKWSPVSDTVTQVLGLPQKDLLDAVSVGSTWYLSGYTASTLDWDTTEAWTLTGSSTITDPSVNPHSLGNGWGHYPFFSGIGSDGNIYVANYHDPPRGSVGGEVGWYPIASGTTGSDRADFTNQNDSPAYFIPIQSASKFAYSAIGSNLFIFDVVARDVTATFQPLTNFSPGVLMETDAGLLLGAGSSNIYLFNPNSGTIVASTNVGKALIDVDDYYDRRLCKGPDGYAWLYQANTLIRVNPTTLQSTPITTNAEPRNVMFFEGDVYLYGTTNLLTIKDVLVQSAGQSIFRGVNFRGGSIGQ